MQLLEIPHKKVRKNWALKNCASSSKFCRWPYELERVKHMPGRKLVTQTDIAGPTNAFCDLANIIRHLVERSSPDGSSST